MFTTVNIVIKIILRLFSLTSLAGVHIPEFNACLHYLVGQCFSIEASSQAVTKVSVKAERSRPKSCLPMPPSNAQLSEHFSE